MSKRRLTLPDEALTWLTDEIIQKLQAIQDPHAKKKRTTVIKLAFAKANQQVFDEVFNQPDTCSRIIWYTKWRSDPDISAAFDVCYRRALEWADEETIELETFYRRRRRQSSAKHAADAPDAIASVMNNQSQDGNARIKAATTLISLADPAPVQPQTAGFINLGNIFGNVQNNDLDAIITNLQAIPGLSPAPEVPEDEK